MILIVSFGALLGGCHAKVDNTRSQPDQPGLDDSFANALTPPEQGLGGESMRFSNIAADVGVRFRHYSPLTSERHVHLVMGSGIGWIDFDLDGWPDLYCCQGASHDASQSNNRPDNSPSNTLYQNRMDHFHDITQQSGLTNVDYSMGISAADYDNDGFIDLCITGYQQNFLYHNNGDGSFSQVSIPKSHQAGRLSASAAWGDIDSDGDLDLFVANYAKLGPEDYPICSQTHEGATIHITCHPSLFDPLHDNLYINAGDGNFEERSRSLGLTKEEAKPGLGVTSADLDLDGDADFYIVNDTKHNQLWENLGGDQFVDCGPESGTSTNRHGAREAGMGVVAGDVDGDGLLDLLVTNYYSETNTLYRNQGNMLFADVTDEFGIAAPSRSSLGFGISLTDFDNDGWFDLLVVNGHVHDRLEEIKREGPFAQLPLLFRNDQGRRFQDVSATSGNYFSTMHVGRGTAVADFDRDGDVDVAVNNLNRPAALLRNDTPNQGNWLRIELIGVESNRSGVGTMLEVDLGERIVTHWSQAGSGYLSTDEATMLIGAGESETVRQLTARWPSGLRESWDSLTTNRTWRLVEGSGKVVVQPTH
jgi:enediyne biosynthesis protein E4